MKSELEVLQSYATMLWDIFVLMEPALMASQCPCCELKRELAKRILVELEQAKKPI